MVLPAASARQVVRAGQYQIAHARKAHNRVLTRTQCDAEPTELDESASNQRNSRVGAETEAITHACADGEHVLDGAANLDADEVF